MWTALTGSRRSVKQAAMRSNRWIRRARSRKIMRETGKSKTCVWRWQERFMHEGVNGLLRDRSRPPGKAPIPPERVAEIVRLTQQAPPRDDLR